LNFLAAKVSLPCEALRHQENSRQTHIQQPNLESVGAVRVVVDKLVQGLVLVVTLVLVGVVLAVLVVDLASKED
jgi:hypothetical protein